jgi:UDP-GlcNAc:undecaprenyl-phosphate GlcNAc-1-phosphate transferase
LLGCFGVIWAQKSVTLLGITAPLMALSIPLLDVLLCIMRRWLRNQPIFTADRGHIHHRLLDYGLTPRQAVFILYGLSSLAAIFSLVQSLADNIYLAIGVVVAFLGVVWIGVHKLGYAEFTFASRLLRLGELQRGVTANITLSSFEKSLDAARTPGECWHAVSAMIGTFGFSAARMQIDGVHYERWSDHVRPPRYWSMRVEFSNQGDYLELARELGSPILPMVAVPFIELIASVLNAKIERQGALRSAADATVRMGT